MALAGPDAALIRWASAIPSIRCSTEAIAPWTGAHTTSDVRTTPTDHFERARFTTFGAAAPILTQGAQGYIFVLARVPSSHSVVLHAGSEREESGFSAVLGDATTPPPRPIPALAAAPKTLEGLGLGSTRAAVERVLGPGRARHTACGTDVVHYVPRNQEMSEANLWFVYRGGSVIAFARYEAV